jgi:hypothetical protein
MLKLNTMTDYAPLTIPAVTLWQPWASLVASGAKPYETRIPNPVSPTWQTGGHPRRGAHVLH